MEIAWHSSLMQRTYTAPVASSSSSSAAFAPPSQTGKRPAHMSTGAQHSSSSFNNSNNGQQLVQSQGHTSSNYSIQSQQSQQSNRSSDTTQGTSSSTLFSPVASSSGPALPGNAGAVAAAAAAQNGSTPAVNDVQPTDNIMNTVADASSSLFHIFVALRQRLEALPGFSVMVAEEEERIRTEIPQENDGYKDIREAFPGYETRGDPVILLWRTLRRGHPLAMLYNTLHPDQPLQVAKYSNWLKQGKAITFRFIQACIDELGFTHDDCFLTSDLFNSDTTGLLKVARVLNRLLDMLVQQNLIEDIRPILADFQQQAEGGLKRTQRQHIVAELVTTERTYVKHLELLVTLRKLVLEANAVGRETAVDIFHNLNALIDHQRRFLIRMEQINTFGQDEQNWGRLFIEFGSGFRTYDEYIANQEKCEKTVVAEFAKLREVGASSDSVEMQQLVDSPTTLYGFLMKPFQRITKYPLLLDDLYKKGDLDDEMKADCLSGKEIVTSVLMRANQAVDRLDRIKAVEELKTRVEDWKGHKVEQFGELLLYGSFTVIKSENSGPGKDGERQYHVYLFHQILLCCKDIDLSKPKNKLSNKQLVDKRGKPKLQLKGRIFMQNVTDLVSLAKPGSYTCQIFWRGDPSIENFIIRFSTEEMMRKWAQQIEALRRGHGRLRNSAASSRYGTSTTEFEFMRNQPAIENPYARTDEDDEDDVDTLVTAGRYSTQAGDLAQSRNSSQTSLRSRSMTGDSGNGPIMSASVGGGRMPPPRMPSGSLQAQSQLSLRTRELSVAESPGGAQFAGDSYFSPTMDSPMSSSVRTSTSSANVYPFPRPQMAQNGYYEEGHGHTRFTAPAMARQRQPSGTTAAAPLPQPPYPDPYAPATRVPSGPVAALHSAQQIPGGGARSRSASSPNIHNAIRGGSGNAAGGLAMRMQPGGADQPPVPDVPAPYQYQQQQMQMPMQFGTIPRSQSNSPSLANGYGGGARGQSYSPQAQRQLGYPPPPQTSQQQLQQQYSRPPTMGSSTAQSSAQYVDGSPVDPRNYQSQQQQQQQSQHQSESYHQQQQDQQTRTPSISTTTTTTGGHSLSPSVSYDASTISPLSASTTPTTVTTPNTTSTAPVPMTQQGPTQLKVKVRCPSVSQTLTLVVPLNISYASLRDRIDAKLQRSTNLCLVDRSSQNSQQASAAGGAGANGAGTGANGTGTGIGGAGTGGAGAGAGAGTHNQVKLKYMDDNDLVSIQSDEDVLTAFETWAEQRGQDVLGMGEIELFCQR